MTQEENLVILEDMVDVIVVITASSYSVEGLNASVCRTIF
jgi:hypothetical protein